MAVRGFAGRKFRIGEEAELRQWTKSDAETVFEAAKKNYEHLQTFMEWIKPDHSLDDYQKFVDSEIAGSADMKSLGFGIFSHSELIGSIGFAYFDDAAKVTEIGYWIAATEEGKGIITKACQILIDFAFNDLGMNRVQIRCATANSRSAAIPERLGFTKEGVQRLHIIRNGKLYDFAIYGLLASEWQKAGLKV